MQFTNYSKQLPLKKTIRESIAAALKSSSNKAFCIKCTVGAGKTLITIEQCIEALLSRECDYVVFSTITLAKCQENLQTIQEIVKSRALGSFVKPTFIASMQEMFYDQLFEEYVRDTMFNENKTRDEAEKDIIKLFAAMTRAQISKLLRKRFGSIVTNKLRACNFIICTHSQLLKGTLNAFLRNHVLSKGSKNHDNKTKSDLKFLFIIDENMFNVLFNEIAIYRSEVFSKANQPLGRYAQLPEFCNLLSSIFDGLCSTVSRESIDTCLLELSSVFQFEREAIIEKSALPKHVGSIMHLCDDILLQKEGVEDQFVRKKLKDLNKEEEDFDSKIRSLVNIHQIEYDHISMFEYLEFPACAKSIIYLDATLTLQSCKIMFSQYEVVLKNIVLEKEQNLRVIWWRLDEFRFLQTILRHLKSLTEMFPDIISQKNFVSFKSYRHLYFNSDIYFGNAAGINALKKESFLAVVGTYRSNLGSVRRMHNFLVKHNESHKDEILPDNLYNGEVLPEFALSKREQKTFFNLLADGKKCFYVRNVIGNAQFDALCDFMNNGADIQLQGRIRGILPFKGWKVLIIVARNPKIEHKIDYLVSGLNGFPEIIAIIKKYLSNV